MNIGWYVRRLANMSVPEITHRVGELWKKKFSHVPSFEKQIPENYPAPQLEGMIEMLHPALHDSFLLKKWELTAARVMEGYYYFLGIDWRRQDRHAPDWHFDPISRTNWPDKPYCFSINYRHNPNMGDIKYVWEINRLQYLQPIAALAHLKQDAALKELCMRHVISWIDSNPPFKGVNWCSGIELALRALSMVIVSTLVEDALTPEEKHKINRCLYLHGYWLDRFPSKFSSANNHLLAEGLGLYLLGNVLPPSDYTEKWRHKGYDIMAKESLMQIYADGFGAEQSPTYTAFALEIILAATLISNRYTPYLPNSVHERLAQAAMTMRLLMDSNNQIPRYGDDDEGRVFFTGFAESDYLASVTTALATQTNVQAAMPNDIAWDFRTLLFGIPAQSLPVPDGVYAFDEGGYTLVRESIQGLPTVLLFDHAPLGYLSIAAHGHADALSIWLSVEDEQVLVDAGTYLYHSGGVWRDYFRGTSAHNTLCIEGENQSQIAGAFNWRNHAKARLVERDMDANAWRVLAEHDGYQSRYGVKHRRLLKKHDHGFVIEDSLVGKIHQPLKVEIGFLLGPGVTPFKDKQGLIISGKYGPLMRFQSQGGLSTTIQEASDNPKRAWYSPHFGHKHGVFRIALSGEMKPDQVQSTLIQFV
jgi:hypothetical protein